MPDNNASFKEFLKSLSSEQELSSQESYNELISKAKDIYKDDYRHSYSSITTYILNEIPEKQRVATLQTLSQNIASIIDTINKTPKEENKTLLDKLTKLQDHINLELIRLTYKEFLKSLSSKQELSSQESYNELISKAKDIYKDDYRHSYSFITTYILNEIPEGQRAATLQTLSQNIASIIDEVGEPTEDNKFLLDKLTKLQDHINLELIRLTYFDNNILSIQGSIQKSEQRFKELDDNIKELDDKTKKELKILDNKTVEFNDVLKTQQNQYITILGIFASIVVAFVGVFSFSTSVLVNIDKSSIYRLVFIVVLIACVFANILYYLFNFIKSLNNSQNQTSHKEIFWFNISMLFMLATDTLCYFIVKIFGSQKIISMIQSLF